MQANTATNVVETDCGAFGMRAGNTGPLRIVELEAHGLEGQVTRLHPVNIGILDFRNQDCVCLAVLEILGPCRFCTGKCGIGTNDHHIIGEDRVIWVRATGTAVLTMRMAVM